MKVLLGAIFVIVTNMSFTGAKRAKSLGATSVEVDEPAQVDSSGNATKVTDQDLLARIDKWLANNNYNQYGDRIDTIYLGGSPLFDETTGIFTDRLTYLLHKFPALDSYYDIVNATDPSIDVTLPSSNPTESGTSGVETRPECPCFDRGDLMWAFNRMADLNVDVAKDLSCNADGISNTLRILYTNIDTADMINGISYTDLSVIYDELGSAPTTNMCSHGKPSMSLDAEQAKACHALLYEACHSIRSRTCPCFDLVALEDFVQDAMNEDIGIDLVHSCKDDTYSIFIEQQVQCIKAPCPPISAVQYGVENYPQMCLNKDSANSAQNVTSQQDMHCRKLLHHLCQVIDNEIIQPNAPPMASECKDSPFYRFSNEDDLDCEWVSQDLHRRCGWFDDYAGSNVFENCRETCGYCSCVDDKDSWGCFDLFDCTWVADNPRERCRSEIARAHCRDTCGNCCRDDPTFKWWRNPYYTCQWVNGKSNLSESEKERRLQMLCGYNAIAQNCPSTCKKCPIEDAISPDPVTVCPCFNYEDHLGPAVEMIKSGKTERYSTQCSQVDGNRYISFNVPDQPSYEPTIFGTDSYKISDSMIMYSCYEYDTKWVNNEDEFNACNALLDEACAQLAK